MEALLKVFLNLALVNQVIGSPQISLEYNPYPLPSYNPNPGQNTAHTVPPGKPWPASAEGYNEFSQTSSVRPKPLVENRFQETTTTARPNLDYGKPPASLEYNPYPLPSYNPNPGENTALTVPPGKPLPANPPNQTTQSLNNRIQEEQKPPRQEVYVIYPEDLWFIYLSDKFREMISKTGTKPTFVFDYKPKHPSPIEATEPWLEDPDQSKPAQNQQQIAENQEDQVEPLIVLDYKQQIYRPSPTEVPPGEPLPVNPEDYPTSSQAQSLENHVGPIPDQVPPLVVLDYKPNRPFYRPSPTEIQQIIPPGQPWPANLEDYATFGQGSSTTPPIQSAPQEIENQFEEVPPEQVQPLIVLDYKPNRPFYRPSPTEVQKIVPPGKHWLANQEDCATFSQSPSPTEVQQIDPPGKPLSAGPSQQTIENLFEEVTTPNPGKPLPVTPIQDTRPDPNPLNLDDSLDKPSSMGGANRNTTNGRPSQNQRPGKPWPANAEDFNSNNTRSTQDIAVTKAETSPPSTEVDLELMLFTSNILEGGSPTILPLQENLDNATISNESN